MAAQSQKNNSQQTYEETQQADQASYNNTMAQWEDIEPKCSQAEATNRTINYKGKHLTAERCRTLRNTIDQLQKQADMQGLDTH
ncbi:putative fatty acyl-CoA reductase CG5065 [Acetobacter orientalis]|uniref:Putative fatty acyl-CoA reductase CG5065 n=1 Tax=Acetobacter orientalis TaxID=146474 RepID=A0A2Z5ZKD5_9PROT|nr:putative fatty acyl-CoA reductase CG5065 [Acetobacter orientalis]